MLLVRILNGYGSYDLLYLSHEVDKTNKPKLATLEEPCDFFFFLALVPTNYLYPYFNSDLCFVVEIIYNVTMAECNGLGAATCLIFL